MKGFCIIVILMFFILSVFCLITVNDSPSMPMGIYLKIPAWNLKEGDIVAFRNPMESTMWGVNSGSSLIIKRIYKIEDDKYYLVGDSDQSYDSRYFGFLGRKYIKNKVVLINRF